MTSYIWSATFIGFGLGYMFCALMVFLEKKSNIKSEDKRLDELVGSFIDGCRKKGLTTLVLKEGGGKKNDKTLHPD